MQLKGCPNLRNFVLSPTSSCPKLTTLNLSHCLGLEYVLVQSNSVQTIDVSGCSRLCTVRHPRDFYKCLLSSHT